MMRRYLRMNKQYVTNGPSRELIFVPMLNSMKTRHATFDDLEFDDGFGTLSHGSYPRSFLSNSIGLSIEGHANVQRMCDALKSYCCSFVAPSDSLYLHIHRCSPPRGMT